MAAGAIIASASRPPRPPRGTTVIVTAPTQPVYINDPRGRMMQLTVMAPAWCQPCSNEPMQITVGGASYYVTTPPQIYAGQTFVAIVPVPLPPPPPVVPVVILTPIFVSEVNFVRTMQVQVPATHGPGMKVSVKMPEGDIRNIQIPPGVFHPNFFTFTYNPTAEAEQRRQKEMMRKLDRGYRCCCQEVDGRCLWYPNWVLKSGPHCPRLMERGELPRCAKDSCGLFGKKGCTLTHHGPGQCTYSMDGQYHFTGGKC